MSRVPDWLDGICPEFLIGWTACPEFLIGWTGGISRVPDWLDCMSSVPDWWDGICPVGDYPYLLLILLTIFDITGTS